MNEESVPNLVNVLLKKQGSAGLEYLSFPWPALKMRVAKSQSPREGTDRWCNEYYLMTRRMNES